MGVVDIHDPTEPADRGVEIGQRGRATRHAVDAVDRQHETAVTAGLGDEPLQGPRFGCRQFHDAGSGGRRRQPRALMNTVVRLPVDHEQVTLLGDRREQADVGKRDARKDEGVRHSEPCGELFLRLVDKHRARESPRRAVVRPPFRQRIADCLVDPGIAVEAEETVRPEVPDGMAVDRHPPVVGGRIEEEILEVHPGVGVEKRERHPGDLVSGEPFGERVEP